MQTVIIVIHLLVVIALVGVVLMQRSEGGGLGIGGGSGFMSARGAANTLTRVTSVLAAAFFATSLGLSLIARYGASPTDILDRIPAGSEQPAGESGSGILDQLGGSATGEGEGQSDAQSPVPDGSGDDAAPAVPSGTSDGAQPSVPDGGGSGSSGGEPQVPTGQ